MGSVVGLNSVPVRLLALTDQSCAECDRPKLGPAWNSSKIVAVPDLSFYTFIATLLGRTIQLHQGIYPKVYSCVIKQYSVVGWLHVYTVH